MVVRDSVLTTARLMRMCAPSGLASLPRYVCLRCSLDGQLASSPSLAVQPKGISDRAYSVQSGNELSSWHGGAEFLETADKPRGGLPRFHVDALPASEGSMIRVEGDEFWHMTKVLRLKVNDRVELFDGQGGIVEGCLRNMNKQGVEIAAVEQPRSLLPTGPNWHVAAAFGSLKGGRADWLVEKCTELGARTVTPLLTQRSSTITGGRNDRWLRIAQAATKQCQRLHTLDLRHPISFRSFLPEVAKSKTAFFAVAEAPPLVTTVVQTIPQGGLLLVGPEGDFTEEEISDLLSAGAAAVGLGPRRLRVETAVVAMLATVMLMSEYKVPPPVQSEIDHTS